MNTAMVTSAIMRIFSAHGSTTSLVPMISEYAYSRTLSTMATATCFSSTPMIISTQRMATTRPNPGCVPTIRKNGPGYQQEQEAELEHDQRDRDEQDEYAGDQRREQRGESDLHP